MNKIFFISGVNGVGKSSIMPHLRLLLSPDKFAIHDFDERGVPKDADKNWRIAETKYWVNQGIELAQKNKNIVICGFVKPEDFQALPDIEPLEIVKILLDAQPEIIRQRLVNRYTKNGHYDESQQVIGKPVSAFIAGNLHILSQMKTMFEELNCPIIDTSNLTPEKVATEVAKIILR